MMAWDDGAMAVPEGWHLVLMDEVDSTNDEVQRRAQGEKEGLVVVAERQLAGRGRRGAAWLSSAGDGLTFSVLLRPSEPRSLWPRLSLAAGLAVAEGLGRFGVEAEIKWPNDILVGGKKLCGILVEAGQDGAVVGIGINVRTARFPPPLDETATSLRMEVGKDLSCGEVLWVVLEEMRGLSGRIGAGFPEVVRRIRQRCWLSGKRVRLQEGEMLVDGVVREIGEKGELVVETASGVRGILQAHEVREVRL